MTKHESSIWFLFKECFTEDWVKRSSALTLLGIRNVLKPLLSVIEERLRQFD